jgi:hypothetical protein
MPNPPTEESSQRRLIGLNFAFEDRTFRAAMVTVDSSRLAMYLVKALRFWRDELLHEVGYG